MNKKLNETLKNKILNYAYAPMFCVLEDCDRPNCHHCFPVKNCKEHHKCINEGQFQEYEEFIKNKIINKDFEK